MSELIELYNNLKKETLKLEETKSELTDVLISNIYKYNDVDVFVGEIEFETESVLILSADEQTPIINDHIFYWVSLEEFLKVIKG